MRSPPMSAPPAASLVSAAPVLAIVVLVLVLRTVRLVHGTRYSPGRLFGFTGFYVFLFGLLGASTVAAAYATFGSVALVLLAPYGAVVVVAALLAAPYVRRIVRFARRPGGDAYYRLPPIVPILSLALFVIRLAVGLAILGGPQTVAFPLPPAAPPGVVVVLVAIDLLFGVSVGLLAGRAVGVHAAYRDLTPSSPDEPLPESDGAVGAPGARR